MTVLIGQDDAIRQLQDALRSGRVHHAWIFHGPMGVGKFTAAIELARLLLSPNRNDAQIDSFEADPETEVGRLIRSGNHPDLHVINRDTAEFSDEAAVRNAKRSNIPVAVLRQFMIGGTVGEKFYEGPANTAPSLGQAKVFIVDDADFLDDAGQNVMLKTLEEPPPRVYFILIAAQPEWLLPTVRSRCRRVSFRPLHAAQMGQWFRLRHPDLASDRRAWISRFADGSPGVAEAAVQHGFDEFAAGIASGMVALDRGDLPPGLSDLLGKYVTSWADAAEKANAKASREAANRDAVSWVLRLLGMHARESLARNIEGGTDPTASIERIQHLQHAERAIGSNVNLKLSLYNLLAQWQVAG